MNVRVRKSPYPYEIVVGELKLSLVSTMVFFKDKFLSVSVKEHNLLRYLALRNGVPVSLSTLALHIYGSSGLPQQRIVTACYNHLRSKFGDDADLYLPQTMKRGYVLRPPSTKTAPST